MSTTHLGLSNTHSPSLLAPAAFLAFNWFHSYCILASRNFKQYHGIDNQASPRQDLAKYGAIAVREGKLTQAQLDRIYRVEGASANSTEGFVLFTGSGESPNFYCDMCRVEDDRAMVTNPTSSPLLPHRRRPNPNSKQGMHRILGFEGCLRCNLRVRGGQYVGSSAWDCLVVL